MENRTGPGLVSSPVAAQSFTKDHVDVIAPISAIGANRRLRLMSGSCVICMMTARLSGSASGYSTLPSLGQNTF